MTKKLFPILLMLFVVSVVIDTYTCSMEVEEEKAYQRKISKGHSFKLTGGCSLANFQTAILQSKDTIFSLIPLDDGEALGNSELPYGNYQLILVDYLGKEYKREIEIDDDKVLPYSAIFITNTRTDRVLLEYSGATPMTIFYTDWNYGVCRNIQFQVYQYFGSWYIEREIESEIDSLNSKIREKRKVDSLFFERLIGLEKELSDYNYMQLYGDFKDEYDYLIEVDFIFDKEWSEYVEFRNYKFGNHSIYFLSKLEDIIEKTTIELMSDTNIF